MGLPDSCSCLCALHTTAGRTAEVLALRAGRASREDGDGRQASCILRVCVWVLAV